MITADRLAQAFAIGSAPATDEYRFGTISEVSADGSVYVRLSNDSTTRCSCLYEASEGDRVQVCIKANGQAVVLGSIGKDDSPKPLAPYVLKDNTSGYDGTVPLDDSVANYQFIDVEYGKGEGLNARSVTRVYSPNGATFSCSVDNRASDGSTWQHMMDVFTASGSSITRKTPNTYYYNWHSSGAALSSQYDSSKSRIYKVIGYK